MGAGKKLGPADEQQGYQLLEEALSTEGALEVDTDSMVSLSPLAAAVSIDSSGQHTLSWHAPLTADDVTIAPGSLNLYTFPGRFAGPELAVIRQIMLELASAMPDRYAVPDVVGANIIHALVVCNTEASLELAFAIFDVAPRLLLPTHAGQPFMDEGNLHIVCVNRRETHACRMVDIAMTHFTVDEVRSFLSTQAVGVFFESPPMCWYGDSPLAYACVFGLRDLVKKMLDTKLVTLNEASGALIGFYPLHAVAANGVRNMYDFLTKELPEGRKTQAMLEPPTRRPSGGQRWGVRSAALIDASCARQSAPTGCRPPS